MPKIIGFLGRRPADICLYTAYALQNTGRSVCVIDNSEDGILYGCVPKPDDKAVSVTFHNVDFMRFIPLVQWHELDYEYILVQLGDTPQQLCLAACSERVLVVDSERSSLDYYRQFTKENSLKMTVLLRGFRLDRVLEKKMQERFKHENCFVKQWITLPINKYDEAYRIGMQYEPLNKFAHISGEMENVLRKILGILKADNTIRIARAVSAAKKGKMAGIVYLHNVNIKAKLTEEKIEYCILE